MKLQAQFEAIDTDHSGYITRRELKKAMKGQGLLTKVYTQINFNFSVNLQCNETTGTV